MQEILIGLAVAFGVALAAWLAGYAVLRHRRPRRAGTFACRLRVAEGAVPGVPRSRKGRRFEAYWVHQVLVVRRTLTPWTVALPVRFPEGDLSTDAPGSAPGRARLRLRLDDGALLALSAPSSAREEVVGPFCALAVRGLPPGVSEGRPG